MSYGDLITHGSIGAKTGCSKAGFFHLADAVHYFISMTANMLYHGLFMPLIWEASQILLWPMDIDLLF